MRNASFVRPLNYWGRVTSKRRTRRRFPATRAYRMAAGTSTTHDVPKPSWPAALLCTLLLVASPLGAAERLSSPGALVDVFVEAVEALETAPADDADDEVAGVVHAAGSLLTSRGTLWYFARDNEEVIVIAPVRFGSSLNALAYRLRKSIGGLSLRFDPRALRDEDAGALYYDESHELLISWQELAAGRVSDYLAHEIVHARNVYALTRGRDNLFMGWIARREGEAGFHDAYPDRFSVDELQAYAQQVRTGLREIARRGPDADVGGTLEMVDAGLALAHATADESRRAADALDAMIAFPSRRTRIEETRMIDDRPVQVAGFRTSAMIVYVFRGRLPEWVVSPPPVTWVAIELAGHSLDFMVPGGISTANDAMLKTLSKRMRTLSQRASRIAQVFEKIGTLAAGERFARALRVSSALRRLARP